MMNKKVLKISKKTFALVEIIALLLVTFPFSFTHGGVPTAEAAFNPAINYQGKLTDENNVTVSNDTFNMQFRLYTAATGGSPVWQETLCFSPDSGDTCDGTGTDSRVQTTSGLFSVLLGAVSSTSLRTVNFNQNLWLGVNIGATSTTPTFDGEMTPRKQIGAVPAAFEALQLDGLATTSLLRSDTSDQFTSGTLTFNSGTTLDVFGTFNASSFSATSTTATSSANILSVGSTTPASNLFFSVGTSSPNLVVDQFSGFVGIGTSTPGSTFSVGGVANLTSATSTFYGNGIDIATGCFAVNGTCVGGGGSSTYLGLSDTPSAFATNTIPYTNATASALLHNTSLTFDGTTLTFPVFTATSTTATSSANIFSVGSTTPPSNTFFSVGTSSPLLVVDQFNGNVGIGTASPSRELHVEGAIRFLSTSGIYSDTGGNERIFLQAGGSDNRSWIFSLAHDDSGNAAYIFRNNAGTDLLNVRADGNVGIGTATPNQLLTVASTTADPAIEFSGGSGSISQWTIGLDDSDGDKFKISSSTILGTNDRFVIDGSGRVGIGTAAPSDALDVVGDIDLTGRVKFDDNGAYSVSTDLVAFTGEGLTGTTLQLFGNDGAGQGIQFGGDSTAGLILELSGSNQESYFHGDVGIGTTSPNVLLTVGSSTPTTVTGYRDAFFAGAVEIDGDIFVDGAATSTFAGNIGVTGDIAGDQLFLTGATSTAANGIDLSAGCFSISGTCLADTGATAYLGLTDTPSAFATNTIPYTNATASALLHNTSLTFDGTTLTVPAISATSTLSVTGLSTLTAGFVSQASSTVVGDFTATGNLTINGTGTSSISDVFSVGSTTPPSNVFFSVGTSSPNLVIDKFNGNVGIGTAVPSVPLHLVANASNPALRIQENTGSEYMEWSMNSDGDLFLSTDAGRQALFIGDSSSAAQDGNVGIGIDPGAIELYVLKDQDLLTSIRVNNTNSGTDIDHTALELYDGSNLGALFAYNNNQDLLSITANEAAGQIAISSGGSEKVRIDASGNVGIGTTSPNVLLTVGSSTPTTVTGYRDAFFAGAVEIDGDIFVDGAATSTFAGNISATGDLGADQLFLSGATSTAANGFDISAGCFAINGTCVGGGGGSSTYLGLSDTPSAFATNTIPYTNATASALLHNTSLTFDGTTLTFPVFTATSTTATSSANILSVGSSTPASNLFFSVGTSSPLLVVDQFSGQVGIGTSTPTEELELAGGFFQSPNTRPLQVVGSLNMGDTLFSNGIDVQGKYVYIAHRNKDVLSIVDVTNPVNPVISGEVTIGNNNTMDVQVAGDYAYVVEGNGDTLQVVDISDPNKPVITGSVSTGGTDPERLALQGKYVYIQDAGTDIMYVFDISDSTNPVSVGSVALHDSATDDIYVSGNYVYTVSPSSGRDLDVYDISNPTAPVFVGFEDNANVQPKNVVVQGRYAYIADDNSTSGLVIVDVSDPTTPSKVGTFDLGFTAAMALDVEGRYAYVLDDSTELLTVLDVASSTNPFIVNTTNLSTAGFAIGGDSRVEVSGGYAYITAVGASSDTLIIVDLSGIDVSSAIVGSLESGSLSVRNSATIDNQLRVRGGLSVGVGGLFAQGPGSFTNFATTSLSSAPAFSANLIDSNNAAVVDVLRLAHIASSSAANNIGTGLLFETEDESGSATSTAQISTISLDVSSTSPNTVLTFSTKNTAGSLTERVRITDGGSLGVGTTSPAQQLSASGLLFIGGTGTSTFQDNLNVRGDLQVGTSSIWLKSFATSTFNGGIDISAGCFAISGTCVGGGGGSTTYLGLTDVPASFTASAIPYTNTGATALLHSANLTYNGTTQEIILVDGSTAPALELDFRATHGSARALKITEANSSNFSGDLIEITRLNGTNMSGDVLQYTQVHGGATLSGDFIDFDYRGVMTGDFIKFTNETGANPRFFIKNTGAVGIGTSTPNQLLTIASTTGDAAIEFVIGTSTGQQWVIGADTSDGGGKFKISSSTALGTNDRFVIDGSGNIGIGTTTPQGLLSVATSTDNSFFTVDDITGFVGIGTSTPQNALHVVNSARFDSSVQLGQSEFAADSGKVAWIDVSVTSSSATDTEQSYTARIDATDILTVFARSDGDGTVSNTGVSIGTTTPAGLFTIATTSSFNILNVNQDGGIVVGGPTGGNKGQGTINAQAVYDDNTLLTDYVYDFYFDGTVREEDEERHSDFRLLSVDELREFIEEERHLPSVTGRDEWREKGGLSVGQLVSQVWEAVEINSIYLTELDSRLDTVDGGVDGAELQGGFNGSNQITPDGPLAVTKLDVTGDIAVTGKLYLSSDSVGQARIPRGSVSVHVAFSSPYLTQPIVTITPVDTLGDFNYAVTNSDLNGFDIVIDKPFDGDATFNYHAFGSGPGAVLSVSGSGSGSGSSETPTTAEEAEEPGGADETGAVDEVGEETNLVDVVEEDIEESNVQESGSDSEGGGPTTNDGSETAQVEEDIPDPTVEESSGEALPASEGNEETVVDNSNDVIEEATLPLNDSLGESSPEPEEIPSDL